MMLAVAARHVLGAFTLDVAFEGPAAGITVLFGPSGAGKSATLAVVAGSIRPAAARVVLGARVLTDTASRIAVPPERRRIGAVHQDARLFPHMPVRRNLTYGMRRAPGRHLIGFDAVVAVLGIAHLLDRRPHDLSGGERQRVALGRAMLSQPDLLLLDEPVSALDAARRGEILDYIVELNRAFALPMLYVTHSVAEARTVGDWLVRIEGGRVIAAGSVAAMLADERMAATVVRHDGEESVIAIAGRHYRIARLAVPEGATVRIGPE